MFLLYVLSLFQEKRPRSMVLGVSSFRFLSFSWYVLAGGRDGRLVRDMLFRAKYFIK